MVVDDSWKWFGTEKGLFYRVYDGTRNRLNKWLVRHVLSFTKMDDLLVVEGGSGPGMGSFFMSLNPRVREAIAMDHDQRALDENKRSNSKFKKQVGDLTKLPFKSNSIDIFWNSSTMEHLSRDDFQKSIKEIHRVLKKDGVFFIGVPWRYGILGPSIFMTKGVQEWVGRLFSKRQLHQSVQNFKLLNTRIYFFTFFIGMALRK